MRSISDFTSEPPARSHCASPRASQLLDTHLEVDLALGDRGHPDVGQKLFRETGVRAPVSKRSHLP